MRGGEGDSFDLYPVQHTRGHRSGPETERMVDRLVVAQRETGRVFTKVPGGARLIFARVSISWKTDVHRKEKTIFKKSLFGLNFLQLSFRECILNINQLFVTS